MPLMKSTPLLRTHAWTASLLHRGLDAVLAALIMDPSFRQAFLERPLESRQWLAARGVVLSDLELSALAASGPGPWIRLAEQIDPHLHAPLLCWEES